MAEPAPDERSRQLLESLPVAAYTCDRDGLITFFNRQALELWGRAPLLNDPTDRWCGSFRLFSAKDGARIAHDECWMALALKTGEAQNGNEILIERPDGRMIVAIAHANPLRDDNGNLVGAVNVLINLSDRQRAEEAQSRLGAIVESSDDAIIGKTLEGRVVAWNAAAERIFGYTAEEAVGQPITLIIPPERRSEETEILARLCRGERIDHYETVRITKDGRRLDISLTSSPIRDSSGRVIGASKVARDVTAKKREEEGMRLLQRMSLRLATALDEDFILSEALETACAIQGTEFGLLFLVDETGSTLRLGPSVGFSEAELATVRPISRGAGVGCLWECQTQQRRAVVEHAQADPSLEGLRHLLKRAGIRTLHCMPLVTRSGKVLGVFSQLFSGPARPLESSLRLTDLCGRQAVDFLENARLYKELQEADRAKNDFLATLSHELRNPLAPIRNIVETLRLTGAGGPELRSQLGVIDRQLTFMTRLIEDLLDVSRITQSKLELRKERVDLESVLHAAIESSRPLLIARGHDFGVDLPPEPIPLEADQARLAQIISNLLNNAAKYTQRGGRIRLIARREGQEADISVRDNGVGIPVKQQSRIFEMFAQVGRSLERSERGLGIGLHLSRRLAELHGGSLTGRSEGEGTGSEFTLRLPIISAGGAVRPRVGVDSAPGFAAPLRILVVDDNRDAADSLGLLLEIPGHTVRIAYDGEQAVQLASEFQPEVILLDIGLPKLDGYQAAERIREQAWGKQVTLIALTGWGQEEARQRSKAAGFDSHLVKPVDPSLLLGQLAILRRPSTEGVGA